MQLSGNAFQDIEIGFDHRSNLGTLDLHCHHLPVISKNSFVNLGERSRCQRLLVEARKNLGQGPLEIPLHHLTDGFVVHRSHLILEFTQLQDQGIGD